MEIAIKKNTEISTSAIKMKLMLIFALLFLQK